MSAHEEQSWANVHSDFDGHLERPLVQMTPEERLDWIWEMMLFRHWLRTEVRRPGSAAALFSDKPSDRSP